MIRTVLIDDEIDSNRILQTLLETYCPQVQVVGTAAGVESAISLIQETGPDLVFMDIEMVQGNAFDLLNQLRPVDFQVIFVTAFDNYAVRAFKYNAIDYLLKPVNIHELRAAVEKLSDRHAQDDFLDRVRSMLDNIKGVESADRKIALPTMNGMTFVVLRDIIRLEARGSTTIIHMRGNAKVTATGTLSEFENLLPDSLFYRVHNSHIINLNKIKLYQKGRGGFVTMEDDSYIEVASRRREGFMERLLR